MSFTKPMAQSVWQGWLVAIANRRSAILSCTFSVSYLWGGRARLLPGRESSNSLKCGHESVRPSRTKELEKQYAQQANSLSCLSSILRSFEYPHLHTPDLSRDHSSLRCFCAPSVLYSPLEKIPDESTADTTADEEDDLLPIDDDAAKSSNEGVIDLPFFHRVDVAELGLPLFTLCVGLVDGFNPCAMWVLVFLLSVLVNLKSRSKLLAVAGTFVFISGLAYFAFMAAWLNLLAWVGFLRPVQIALALLAIGVGIVHVKDFFALHRGLSLSIPESAKPGIYRRVREIVQARSLMLAIGGAIVLAVLVNFIELLCTAGLPCLYSQILTMQNLPWWKDYLYLASISWLTCLMIR